MDNAKFDGISRWCYYTRTELIDSIVELAKRLGHTPTRTELARDIYTPSVKAYERAFGTVANAIHAANLPASDPLVK
ncbi:hypothetical protein IJ135_00715, partial [Candidatus Saccharibacteria bacterium]|nr:hypothetical protein [Candidatus Saccharibacteria bacterium]